ncbi:MAG: hypothetical protein GXO73_01845 [Calditrichaeota bacterium]|nr:hypothetical protein [Calditrichota bacterium]
MAAKASGRETKSAKPSPQTAQITPSPASQSAAVIPADTTQSVQDTPTCPNCGIAMVLRAARKGQAAGERFWGCPRFPKCRGLQQKT